jgi:aconitate hydratase
MHGTLTAKILSRHLVAGQLRAGEEIGIRIDQTLTQDATGTMAALQFEALGVPRARTELSVSYIDHNTIQIGYENADDHRYLRTFAGHYGVWFSPAGNGICHQIHLQRFGRPGRTLIGSDSHTTTAGALGMFAAGVGGLDVALAMAGEPFYLIAPRVIRVWLSGQLPRRVSAKDLILEVLRRLSSKGNVGKVLEYAGPGLATLSVPQRATIANMGAELGVTTSIFPSDEQTRQYLAAQGRAGHWEPLAADDDAAYDSQFEVNLSGLEPLVALPHHPDNVVPVSEVAGRPVQQVLIGSCTNGGYADLTLAAKMVAGRRVAEGVSFGVAPASRQVMRALAKSSHLTELIDAGARVLEPTCGFCIGVCQAPESDAVSVRTNNRNFEGRTGTASAKVYLVSPQTAAATALTGVLTDPRTLDLPAHDYEEPDTYWDDGELFIAPPDAHLDVEIQRGPNIKPLPINEPFPDSLTGVVSLKVGDKITTDQIMPAGAYLKYRSNVPRYAQVVFEPLDPTFAGRALGLKQAGAPHMIVAGESYGQGSSREHAALCPMYLGVKIVLARSIERIHLANLVNFGILPLFFKDAGDYARLQAGDGWSIANLHDALRGGNELTLHVGATRISVTHTLTPRQAEMLLAGGALNAIRSKKG